MEEITVTARKQEESAQTVPLAITAVGSAQIDALKIRDLTNLAVSMPNVAMDDIGTSKGNANFSIRGLGINSSIPSIDPTVGLFVDGVYMGVNTGVLFDTFDLEAIEVLRGPQGTLFGKNVTGGAVLLRTQLPTEEFTAKVRHAVEGGGEALNQYSTASVAGPLADTLRGKLVVHYSDDGGWFENQADGEAFGEIRTEMLRGVLAWDVTDHVETILRLEYQETDGDGPAAQSHTNGSGVPGFWNNSDRDSFDFAVNGSDFQRTRTNFAVSETRWQVDFGEGEITNIAGWRTHTQDVSVDVDSTPLSLLHIPSSLETEQFSNELRYSGTFAERWHLTTGLYYFTNEVGYYEHRDILGGALTLDGGGDYEVDSMALFSSVDYDLSDRLTLTGGVRFTREDKAADIASLIFNVNQPCNILDGTCPFDFSDDQRWNSTALNLGARYELQPDTLLYGRWSRSFRSGGYNLRNTAASTDPSAFDEEQVDSYEIGVKWDATRRARINAALFYTEVEDMQREISMGDEGAGLIQLVKNTADATVTGAEVEATYALTDSTALSASAGYTDNSYDRILFDLNSDGLIDAADKSLELPRAAAWTWSAGLSHDHTLGEWGYLSARVSYAFRDESYYTDDNLGYIDDQSIVDAGIDFYSNDGHWQLGLYGKNLLDQVKHGGDTQLPASVGPAPLGGTFSPLARGRVYGLDVTYNF
jgi:iron complex outermembrane receptor protein